jgi:hypothetical protein
MSADVAEQIDCAINRMILDVLPKHLYAGFAKSIDAGEIDFLAKNVPEIDQHIREAVTKFASEYLCETIPRPM